MRRQSLCGLIFCAAVLFFAQLLQGQTSGERPELVAQTGHVFPIWKLAFSDDGRLLASASFTESSVVLWDVESEQQLRTLNVQADAGAILGGVRSLALSPNGGTLAVGTDSEIAVFNVKDGKELYRFASKAQGFATSSGIIALAYSPSSRLLAAMEGNSIETWDLSTGNSIRSFPQPGLVAGGDLIFSSDEHHLAASTYGQGDGGMVRVFDLSSGNVEEHPFTGRLPAFINHGLAYTSDGHLVALSISRSSPKAREEEVMITEVISAAKSTITKINNSLGEGINVGAALSAKGTLVALSEGSTLRIFDTSSHREIKTFNVPVTGTIPFQYLATAFTPDQKLIATGSADGRIHLWDPLTGQPTKTLKGHANLASTAAFSQDGSRLFTGTKTQWDLNSGIGLRATSPQSTSQVAVVSADGRFLAAVNLNDSIIQIWDLVHQQLIQSLRGPQDTIANRVAISPDGSVLAATYREDPTALQRNQAAMQQHTQHALANYKNMAAGMKQDSPAVQIKLWNTQSGGELATSNGHTELVGGVSFTADGKRLVSVSKAEVRVWEIPSGKLLNSYQTNIAAQSPMAIFASGLTSTSLVKAIALSPDGQALAVAEMNIVTQFDSAAINQTKKQIAAASQSQAKRSRFGGLNPFPQSGKKAQPPARPQADLTKGGIHVEGPVEIFRMSDGKPLGTLPGHTSGADSVAFSPDGKLLASGGADHMIRLWSVSDGSLVRELTGETSAVNSLSFSADGKLLSSSANSGATRIWEVATGEQLATLFSLNDGADWLVVTPDGLFDGSPAAWRQIIWRYGGDTFNVYPVEIFFNEFFYPGLLADILRGKHPKATQDISQKDRRQPHLTLKLADSDATNGSQPVSKRVVNLEIHIADAPAGARDVRLFRNGSLVKVWHGDVLKQSSTMLLTARVPILAGQNNFTAYGFNNDNIKSPDTSLSLLGAESLRAPSIAYVLAIGINAYENSEYNLKYAASDARSFSQDVQREQARLGKFSQVKVVQLLDNDATKANILFALHRLSGGGNDAPSASLPELQELKPAQPEDTVIIYYAGHGTARKARFYLVPHDLGYMGSRSDLKEAGVNTILEHSISDQELATALEGVDAGQLLLVIDACNSGQALEAEEKRRGPMNSKGLAQLAYEKGIDILAAAQSYQAALEAQQLGHGYLTYSLVEEGLKTPAADTSPKDGQVDVREWLDYATERVPQMQEAIIRQAREQGRELSFAEEEEPEHTEQGLQRPRVFYRREAEFPLFIVSRLQPSVSK